MQPFNVMIDWNSGTMSEGDRKTRRVSDMQGMYHNQAAARDALDNGDPKIYEYTTIQLPQESDHVLFGTTTVFPGRIGSECFMTKGHYHEQRATGEVYVCFSGHGRLIMETEDGAGKVLEMLPGSVSYVPPYWAHRVCNVGDEPLIFFAAFPGHAGHDYGSIEQSGFSVRVERYGDEVVVVDNL